jgi:hypothetical protein
MLFALSLCDAVSGELSVEASSLVMNDVERSLSSTLSTTMLEDPSCQSYGDAATPDTGGAGRGRCARLVSGLEVGCEEEGRWGAGSSFNALVTNVFLERGEETFGTGRACPLLEPGDELRSGAWRSECVERESVENRSCRGVTGGEAFNGLLGVPGLKRLLEGLGTEKLLRAGEP